VREVMKEKRKRVLCLDADSSFIDNQEEQLARREIGHYFFGFTDFGEAIRFLEKEVIPQNEKLHYILLDQKMLGQPVASSLEQLARLQHFLKKTEIIVCTREKDDDLRNKVMQYPFISAFLVKPIPENYIAFLITGCSI
jgi:response regulator RpfG family c-di-GMP phosphodiesterase